LLVDGYQVLQATHGGAIASDWALGGFLGDRGPRRRPLRRQECGGSLNRRLPFAERRS
jgi:hypothetical protein